LQQQHLKLGCDNDTSPNLPPLCKHSAAAISYIMPLLLNSGAGFPAGRGILNHTATTRFIPGHEQQQQQQQQQRGYKSHYRHLEYFTKHITQNI
jgi:hypothetical protein